MRECIGLPPAHEEAGVWFCAAETMALSCSGSWRLSRRVTDQKYDDPVKITGTIEDPSGEHERIDAEGATYEQARQALAAKVPEGHKLIAIRTN
ncbi:hypothetical protein [Pseudarthrobacter sp. Y6]|uniref:hypothetical protein n=1 Tax=Pseudarthrobacter sp. Y6 TaxID=3418422 RepID=UPI003CEE424E